VSLEKLARASCAIYVNGRRQGSGTLVTDAYVLTAAHVLRGGGALTIRLRDDLTGDPIPVMRVPLSDNAEELDIAILELKPVLHMPPPATLWPARRLPLETRTFGYPKLEGAAPRGVWRDSVVSGGVQGGRVQLDWRDVGTLEGHSGGPVCDKLSGLMVGILVEGSQAGHFDLSLVTSPR
jgi:Trypsin-like peptidase domain